MSCGKEMMLTRNELGRIQDRGICGHGYVCEECATAATEESARYKKALEEIKQRGEAYPVSVFPEPDFKKAHKLLQAGGMTLDAISASNMRRVASDLAEIAAAALSIGG